MVCVCSGHSSVFGLFRADCFVCVSPQELLPEEILQGSTGGRQGGEETHWEVGKAPGWASPGSVTCRCFPLCKHSRIVMGKPGKENLLVNGGAPSSPEHGMGSAAASKGCICAGCEPKAERRAMLGHSLVPPRSSMCPQLWEAVACAPSSHPHGFPMPDGCQI